jgi:hypothetical protein
MEYDEILEKVREDVSFESLSLLGEAAHRAQKESGAPRTYAAMWRQYKRRVLLAMSSQAFAQLVSSVFPSTLPAS